MREMAIDVRCLFNGIEIMTYYELITSKLQKPVQSLLFKVGFIS